MPPEDRIRILHMLEATETLARFVAGKERADLDADDMLLFAVVRVIEVLGEAASKVTVSTRASTAEIPWHEIVATRNRLIHAYFDVDPDIVWRAATEDVPPLTGILRKLIATTA